MAIDPLMVRNLSGERANEGGPVEVVRDFTYQFRPGAFYELSGSEFHGKSLMLHLLGLLSPPKSGDIFVDGSRVNDLDVDSLSYVRTRKYGFLFSAPFFLPTFTLLENFPLPLFKTAVVESLKQNAITHQLFTIL